MHDKLVIGETAPTDFDNPTVIDMNHTEPGDGRENLGVTTSTFDTLYAGYTGETAITFDTGYIAKIGTLPSSIDVEDACVPQAIYDDFISKFKTATGGLDLSVGVTDASIVYPTIKLGNQLLKLKLT